MSNMEPDKMIHLSGRIQRLAVEMYKMSNTSLIEDEFMRKDMLNTCLHLYTNAAELCEKEDEFFRDVSIFGGLRMHFVSVNSQLLMCFQLGLLGSDVCIEFGYKLEQLKEEIKVLYMAAKKEMEDKNPFKDFEEE
jgi:hypothetical protein